MGQIVESSFQPAWWLPGAHLQTIWPSLVRRRPRLAAVRRRVELDDGDFIDLAVGARLGPRVLIVHGLEGDLQSHYAGTLMEALSRAGYSPIFMHLRGCSGEPNRLDRSYHSGASADLHEVLRQLSADPEGGPVAAIGFSLGANLLLKYLGERASGEDGSSAQGDPWDPPLLHAAVGVSVPFVLRDAMLRLDLGGSKLYRRYLLDKLRRGFKRKYAQRPCPLRVDIDGVRDFNRFDEEVTAPLCGFAGVFDYYQRASCRQFLPRIRTPTLIVHSLDDPFMFPSTVPFEHELGPGITLELTRRGGHVGFVSGPLPWRPVYWLEQRIVAFLKTLKELSPS